MEKYPFPKLKIAFNTGYGYQPVDIKFNNNTIKLPKGIFYIEHQVESVQDIIEIEFLNFVPQDSLQSVLVNISHNDEKKDTSPLCTFEMKNNQYVENENKSRYNTIFFNGTLKITFFKQWFECHIVSGAQILNQRNLPVQWPMGYESNSLRFDQNKKDYDVVCLGCSVTYGSGLENDQTWPHLLGKQTNSQVANLGTPGAGIDSILKQFFYVKRNITAKQIYILLPGLYRKRIKFYFGDELCEYRHCLGSTSSDFLDKGYLKKVDKAIIDQSVRRGKKIIKFLERQENVKLTSWDDETYDILDHTKRLAKYNQSDEITSLRASDGTHPHTKHNEHFVNSLRTVDKSR